MFLFFLRNFGSELGAEAALMGMTPALLILEAQSHNGKYQIGRRQARRYSWYCSTSPAIFTSLHNVVCSLLLVFITYLP